MMGRRFRILVLALSFMALLLLGAQTQAASAGSPTTCYSPCSTSSGGTGTIPVITINGGSISGTTCSAYCSSPPPPPPAGTTCRPSCSHPPPPPPSTTPCYSSYSTCGGGCGSTSYSYSTLSTGCGGGCGSTGYYYSTLSSGSCGGGGCGGTSYYYSTASSGGSCGGCGYTESCTPITYCPPPSVQVGGACVVGGGPSNNGTTTCPDGEVLPAGYSCPVQAQPQPQPVQASVYCTGSNTYIRPGQTCPPVSSPPAQSPPPPAQQPAPPPPASPPSLAATVTISGQNPVKVTIHANQYLDLRHSIVFNLDPSVQATGVQVSTGTATIQGNQVIWNGFTMNAGDDASAVINLVATGGTVVAAPGSPSIQGVTIEALDQTGNQVLLFNPGGGPQIAQLSVACSTSFVQAVVTCGGTGIFSVPPFTVNAGWSLAWTFNSCPDTSSGLTLTVLNSDGSQMDNETFGQPPASGAGTQHYDTGGSYSLGVNSPCTWSVQVLQQ